MIAIKKIWGNRALRGSKWAKTAENWVQNSLSNKIVSKSSQVKAIDVNYWKYQYISYQKVIDERQDKAIIEVTMAVPSSKARSKVRSKARSNK